MNALIPLRTLATQINAEHMAAMADARSAIQHARRAGELLTEAKKQQPYGAWLPWLAAECPQIPARTAQAYMRVGRHPEIAAESFRQALAKLATPRAANTQRVAHLNADALTGDVLRQIDEAIAAGTLRDAQLEGAVVPVESGWITVGYVNHKPAHLFIESARNRGYWYSAEASPEWAVTTRPMAPIVWQAILGRETSFEWGSIQDDGYLGALIEPLIAGAAMAHDEVAV